MIRLHDYILSADCYKIRLMLAVLGLRYELKKVDVHPGRENESAHFRRTSPLGRIPVLEDEDLVLWDPNAILTYLALRYGESDTWLPGDAARHASVMMWLGFAASELEELSQLRMDAIVGVLQEAPGAVERAHASLMILEDHLAEGELLGRAWMVGDRPTIADIGLFPPVALAADGGVSLDVTPAVWRWLGRVKRIKGFVVMPGVTPLFADPA